MRIVIDLDGVICTIKRPEEHYADVRLIPGVVEKLTELKNAGHYIIIQTARNMATCESNVGKVMKNVGQVTFDWLAKHQVPYDEIYFGKPNAHVYIDDRALRFTSWNEITAQALQEISKDR
jgi:capsule biosynthesis phosphatase